MEVSGRRETTGDDQILCQPCHGEGDEVSAEGYCENCNEYFCSSCLKVHRKMAVTKNHVIKTKDEMPRAQKKTDICVEPCDIHKTEIVKYYCRTHDSVGCADCMVIVHKTCKVELVLDVSGNYDNSDEIKMINRKMKEVEKIIGSIKQEMKGHVKSAADMKVKIVKEIEHFREELNTYLDQAKADLINEIDQLTAKDIAVQKVQLQECDEIESEIKQFQQAVEEHEDKIDNLFVKCKRAKKRLEKYEESINHITSVKIISSYTFEPSKDLQAFKESKSTFGTLSVETKNFTAEEKKSIKDMKAQYVGELNARASIETSFRITGMAMISKDEVLLADYNNKSLKIMYTRENKIISRFTSSSLRYPWGVTMISADQSAATYPAVGKILFVNTRRGLSESHKFEVKKWCRGIAYHSGKIAVSYTSLPQTAVEILNMKGNILIHSDFPTNLFRFPTHLCFSNDGKSVFLSDEYLNKVLQHTFEGQLNAIISESVKRPKGLTITKDGSIVVCNNDDKDKLVLIVPDTRKVLPLFVKHVSEPMSVLICQESSKMYISESSLSCIKVYDLL